MKRFLWTALVMLIMPLALIRLAWRGLQERGYWQHIPERFSFYGKKSETKESIWIHAVSVGEARAVAPLVEALQKNYPHHRIVITQMTPAGRRTSNEIYAGKVTVTYAPYDIPFLVNRFIRHFNPMLLLLVETEIWPNWIYACKKNTIPALLINARLSEKSFRAYQRFSFWIKPALHALTAVAAQTPADAERLAALGAHSITVSGNLKFDVEPNQQQIIEGREWRKTRVDRFVWIAASTREGEEELLLQVQRDLIVAMPDKNPLMILVPRHPQRFEEVEKLIEKNNLRLQRKSGTNKLHQQTQVLLGNTMGEMYFYYALADVAVMGGSWLPFGGQNPIEPAQVGLPIIVGPYTYNFAQVVKDGIKIGAMQQMQEIKYLVDTLQRLATNDSELNTVRINASRFAEMNKGALEKQIKLIKSKMG